MVTILTIPDFYNVGTRTGELLGGEDKFLFRRQGVYSELTLGYKEYLFLTATARNDWSSSLPTQNRSFFYPGAGLSFLVSEAFPGIKSEKGIDNLKATLNVTKSGNDAAALRNKNHFHYTSRISFHGAQLVFLKAQEILIKT